MGGLLCAEIEICDWNVRILSKEEPFPWRASGVGSKQSHLLRLRAFLEGHGAGSRGGRPSHLPLSLNAVGST